MTDQKQVSPDDGTAEPGVLPADRERLEQLTRAIDSGEYTIDSKRIAGKLIDSGFPQEVNPE